LGCPVAARTLTTRKNNGRRSHDDDIEGGSGIGGRAVFCRVGQPSWRGATHHRERWVAPLGLVGCASPARLTHPAKSRPRGVTCQTVSDRSLCPRKGTNPFPKFGFRNDLRNLRGLFSRTRAGWLGRSLRRPGAPAADRAVADSAPATQRRSGTKPLRKIQIGLNLRKMTVQNSVGNGGAGCHGLKTTRAPRGGRTRVEDNPWHPRAKGSHQGTGLPPPTTTSGT
jgi:hypothetical protein